MNVRVQSAAKKDLKSGWTFYETQQTGLGDEFIESILNDLAELPKFAGIHSMRYGHHRALCSRFPFAIYYVINGNDIIVRAIFDGRRRPSRLAKRLS